MDDDTMTQPNTVFIEFGNGGTSGRVCGLMKPTNMQVYSSMLPSEEMVEMTRAGSEQCGQRKGDHLAWQEMGVWSGDDLCFNNITHKWSLETECMGKWHPEGKGASGRKCSLTSPALASTARPRTRRTGPLNCVCVPSMSPLAVQCSAVQCSAVQCAEGRLKAGP
jgi:hypothetical protein